jgi:hypothetical protein
MAEQTASSPPAGSLNGSSDAPDLAALRDELARSREEVMRLRDLLIAKDRELGQVRGRLEQLEARTTRLLGAAAWLRRFGPPFARLRAMLRGRP